MSDQFNILEYTDGPLLQTGQIIDLTPPGRTTKDDGGFQRGIPGSKTDNQYIVLTTGQYSGTTNVTIGAVVDAHDNACVFDKVSGLMWSRTITPAIYGGGATNLAWDDTGAINEDIFNYCDQANISTLSSFSDWRVPNVNELESLILYDSGIGAPFINQTAFPVWTTGALFSSTTDASSLLSAYQLNFSTGRMGRTQKIAGFQATCLVRLGIEQ